MTDLFESHPRWGDPAARAIARATEARFAILVECGCLVGPIKRGDPVLERTYTELLDQFCRFPVRA